MSRFKTSGTNLIKFKLEVLTSFLNVPTTFCGEKMSILNRSEYKYFDKKLAKYVQIRFKLFQVKQSLQDFFPMRIVKQRTQILKAKKYFSSFFLELNLLHFRPNKTRPSIPSKNSQKSEHLLNPSRMDVLPSHWEKRPQYNFHSLFTTLSTFPPQWKSEL